MINASPKLCFNTDKLALPQNFQFPALRGELRLVLQRHVLTTIWVIKAEESMERVWHLPSCFCDRNVCFFFCIFKLACHVDYLFKHHASFERRPLKKLGIFPCSVNALRLNLQTKANRTFFGAPADFKVNCFTVRTLRKKGWRGKFRFFKTMTAFRLEWASSRVSPRGFFPQQTGTHSKITNLK